MTVAYHDACHLAHGQRIRTQPRELLRRIPGLTLVDLKDADLCCGSAGVYNLVEPEIAGDLGRQKAARIAADRSEHRGRGQSGLPDADRPALPGPGREVEVAHPVSLLARALDESKIPAMRSSRP